MRQRPERFPADRFRLSGVPGAGAKIRYIFADEELSSPDVTNT
jgi:hypothetical protein